MESSLRLFIAIEPDDALRVELDRLERALRDALPAPVVRWVIPKNIHLTIKFLGNVQSVRVPALTVALARASTGIAPHQLTASGLGAFPNFGRPNNIWVGLDGDAQTTALLARRIEDECAREGFARAERGFNPHLTLGRLKREASNAERAAVGRALQAIPKVTYGTIQADAVYLIASDLRPTGPGYKTLAKISLGENGERR